MSKYVLETKAAGQISAWLILKGKRVVGRVLAHHTSSRTLVNVFQDDRAAERSTKAAIKAGTKITERLHFQHASASGYGYDKLTSAFAGLYFDGHKLTDHCSTEGIPKRPEGSPVWPRDFKFPKGYHGANYISPTITFGFDPTPHDNPNYDGEPGYSSCYREPGMDYLKSLGYSVQQVI